MINKISEIDSEERKTNIEIKEVELKVRKLNTQILGLNLEKDKKKLKIKQLEEEKKMLIETINKQENDGIIEEGEESIKERDEGNNDINTNVNQGTKDLKEIKIIPENDDINKTSKTTFLSKKRYMK